MTARPHILVVNGRKVREPVFIIGAPHSGADLLARALKRSPGFHITMGQGSVLSVVHAFAQNPSIHRGRDEAAATVLRDAFAQAWQITAHACLTCSAACREAGGVNGAGACMAERDIARYGDASPDLMYCAEALVDAFTDARLVQIVRDGRDVVAAMLADTEVMAWFKPGAAKLDSEFAPVLRRRDGGRPGRLARPVAGGQMRDALARLGAHHGQAAQQARRRAAHHPPL